MEFIKVARGHYRLYADDKEHFADIQKEGLAWVMSVGETATGNVGIYSGVFRTLSQARADAERALSQARGGGG
jgi:hypothetical protein